MTRDYKRNGTATLFAALNTADGTVISMCDDRHRHQEWLEFLRVIHDVTPAVKELHRIYPRACQSAAEAGAASSDRCALHSHQ